MIKSRKINFSPLFFIIVVLFFSSGYGDESRDKAIPELDCSECHKCQAPSYEDPCLKACPRFFLAQVHNPQTLAKAPDRLLLDKLVDKYGAVDFSHKLHAEMAEMDKGCSTCHHFIPKRRVPPCSDCHTKEANPANLRQPSLQAVYHRQCLTCHREWSHTTECRFCHLPVEEVKSGKAVIEEKPKSLIANPITKVYNTSFDEGPVVTFHHEQHVELFNLSCVDCHKNESCRYCHDLQKPASLAKTPDEMHDICSSCHDIDNCQKCHDTKERPAFSHVSTGWSLGKYHSGLGCRACHPKGKKISKLSTSCVSCHAGWNQETFKHAVTGLKLDEIHSELDCGDCHVDKKFKRKPDCSACHDDNRSPKKHPPGTYVKLSGK